MIDQINYEILVLYPNKQDLDESENNLLLSSACLFHTVYKENKSYFVNPPKTIEYAKKQLFKSDILIIAHFNDECISFVSLKRMENLKKHRATIIKIVHKEYRNQGLCTLLTKEALKICKNNNIEQIHNYCKETNLESIRSFTKISDKPIDSFIIKKGIKYNDNSYDNIVCLTHYIERK